jgi:tetratricopeptide (TPR) repeat protein
MVRTLLAATAIVLTGVSVGRAEEPASVPKAPVETARANAKGNALVEKGEYGEAAKIYREEALKRPENAVLQQNLAGALARSDQLEEGLAAYSQAVRFADTPKARAGALYDLGNALATSGQLEPALQTYMAGMLLDPEDMELRHNYELVLKQLQEQQQQEQQQSEKPQQSDGDQDQDQQEQPDPQQQDQDQPSPQDQQQQEQQQQEQQQDQVEEAEPDDTEQMSPEDAKRLLDAMLEEEKELQAERSKDLAPRNPDVEKDW